jgi:hypothetical protein
MNFSVVNNRVQAIKSLNYIQEMNLFESCPSHHLLSLRFLLFLPVTAGEFYDIFKWAKAYSTPVLESAPTTTIL